MDRGLAPVDAFFVVVVAATRVYQSEGGEGTSSNRPGAALSGAAMARLTVQDYGEESSGKLNSVDVPTCLTLGRGPWTAWELFLKSC